jgi:hypothetical protein
LSNILVAMLFPPQVEVYLRSQFSLTT